jgi:hypothetical protein
LSPLLDSFLWAIISDSHGFCFLVFLKKNLISPGSKIRWPFIIHNLPLEWPPLLKNYV